MGASVTRLARLLGDLRSRFDFLVDSNGFTRKTQYSIYPLRRSCHLPERSQKAGIEPFSNAGIHPFTIVKLSEHNQARSANRFVDMNALNQIGGKIISINASNQHHVVRFLIGVRFLFGRLFNKFESMLVTFGNVAGNPGVVE